MFLTSSSCCCRNSWRSSSASYSLSASGLTGPIRRSSRSSSRARAGSVMPSGTSGIGRGERDVGFAVELVADALDGLLEPQPDLGLFDLEPARRARAARRAASRPRRARCAGRRAGGRLRACRFRLLLAALAQPFGERSISRLRARAARAIRPSTAARARSSWARRARGLRLLVGAGREPRFDVRQPPAEHRAALFDGGAADFEVLAQLGGLRAQPFAARACAAARVVDAALALGEPRVRSAAFELSGELGEPRASSSRDAASATSCWPLFERRGRALRRRAGAARRGAVSRSSSVRRRRSRSVATSSARRAAASRWRALLDARRLGVAPRLPPRRPRRRRRRRARPA